MTRALRRCGRCSRARIEFFDLFWHFPSVEWFLVATVFERIRLTLEASRVSPRRATHFLCFAKESKQRKATPTARDPSLRCGQPALLAPRGKAANSLRSNMRPSFSALCCAARHGQRGPQPESGLVRGRGSPLPLVPFWLCRGAQRQAETGPCMFEPKASLHGPRLARAPQVARSEAQGHRR